MKNRIIFLASMLLLLACKENKSQKPLDAEATVGIEKLSEPKALFQQGESGYACFRIPALIKAANGDVLAFCEARKNGCSDTGDIDLVMKRSTDQGQSWGELEVIWDDGKNVCGNPAPVLEEKSGNIHLLLTWNKGTDHESEIIAGESEDTRRVFHLSTEDHGESWTEPKEITATTKLPNWTWYATGPVHGIQMKQGPYAGRLVIPCDHIEAESKKYYSHVIYSDDQGSTWQLGGTTPQDQVNECTIAELPNGDLLLNMRNYARKESQSRQIAISKDGGLNWEDQKFDTELPEPRCQAAMLAVKRGEKELLLFSNPAHGSERKNMSLAVSEDQGASWSAKKTIYAGNSAYSDLVEMDNGQILLFHEGGENSAYDAILYSLLSIQ
ncbi:MAG: sialidase family protein [Bacteroidia bacterium]|nr:sialidase family protein [Bacteroidia bacterium]